MFGSSTNIGFKNRRTSQGELLGLLSASQRSDFYSRSQRWGLSRPSHQKPLRVGPILSATASGDVSGGTFPTFHQYPSSLPATRSYSLVAQQSPAVTDGVWSLFMPEQPQHHGRPSLRGPEISGPPSESPYQCGVCKKRSVTDLYTSAVFEES